MTKPDKLYLEITVGTSTFMTSFKDTTDLCDDSVWNTAVQALHQMIKKSLDND